MRCAAKAALAGEELRQWGGRATVGSIRGALSICGPYSHDVAHQAVMLAVMLGQVELIPGGPDAESELRLLADPTEQRLQVAA